MYIMHNMCLYHNFLLRLHILHIQTLRKQCIWAEIGYVSVHLRCHNK